LTDNPTVDGALKDDVLGLEEAFEERPVYYGKLG
jgi:hypothetical protein